MIRRPTRRGALAVGALVVGLALGVAAAHVLAPWSGQPEQNSQTDPTPPVGAGPGPAARGAVGLDSERGRPAFAARFGTDDHGGHRQSWSVVQATSGLVYVANTNGVLEYDGVEWRLISVPNDRARAVATGPDGAVYVGGEGTAGFLVPDSTGRQAYRELIGADVIDGGIVWEAFADADGVTFQTLDRLVRVERGAVVDVEQAPSGRRFHKAFSAAGGLYVRLEGVGLLRYHADALHPIPGGEAFAETPARALFDADGRPGGPLLVVTDDELFRLDPATANPAVPVPTAATALLRETRAYHGCPLGPAAGPGRLLAVTTLGGGVLVLDAAGRLVQHLGPASGLTPDDLVLGCAADAQGGLWLALSEGVARIDAAAPLSVYDDALGLPGFVYDVARHGGRMYAATERGVYRLRPSADGAPVRFEPVRHDGADLGQAWALLPTGRGLLVAATDGVFAVEGDRARRVLSETAFTLAPTPGAVYAGLASGVAVLRLSDGEWAPDGRLDAINGEVRSVEPDGVGGAWVAERGGRLAHVGRDSSPVRLLDADDGVPPDLAFVERVGETILAVAEDGPYRVATDGGAVSIARDTALTRLVQSVTSDLSDGFSMIEDAEGRLWVAGQERTRAFTRSSDGWADVTPASLRALTDIKAVETEGETVWVAAGDLYRLAAGGHGRYALPVPTHVRSVEADGAELPSGSGAVTAPYGQTVRLRFAASAYNDPGDTEYRTQLAGHDEAPSPWSAERYRDYTNLPPGDYTFHVEGRTAQGTRTVPAAVRLTVPAPWYLTPWAVALGALLAVSAVGAVAQVVSARHRRRADAEFERAEAEAARAEAEAARAEAEVRAAAAERARADEHARLAAELRRQDQLKDEMLSNASHELRTPLTAILGYSEFLAEYEGGDPDDVRDLASHMLSGGRRLLHTVNDLLDNARLRAGKVEIHPEDLDVADVARSVVRELRPLAAKKGLDLFVLPEDLALPARLDPDALARVVTNLVSNAVKFTAGGRVVVSVDGDDHDVRLTVRDTGRGIGEAFLPRLFEPYEQESVGYGREAEGTGLGLSITARLAELMGGRVEVESEVGSGSTFRVTLPRYDMREEEPPETDPHGLHAGDGAVSAALASLLEGTGGEPPTERAAERPS